jgi:hypothetical protein
VKTRSEAKCWHANGSVCVPVKKCAAVTGCRPRLGAYVGARANLRRRGARLPIPAQTIRLLHFTRLAKIKSIPSAGQTEISPHKLENPGRYHKKTPRKSLALKSKWRHQFGQKKISDMGVTSLMLGRPTGKEEVGWGFSDSSSALARHVTAGARAGRATRHSNAMQCIEACRSLLG